MLLTQEAARPSAAVGGSERQGWEEGRCCSSHCSEKLVFSFIQQEETALIIYTEKAFSCQRRNILGKQPLFPPTVFGGHLLPSHHRVIRRACFGSPASVTYGAR